METEISKLNALVNRLASLVLKLEDVVAWEGESPPATPTPTDARTTPADARTTPATPATTLTDARTTPATPATTPATPATNERRPRKRYTCPDCGISCTRRRDLERHRERVCKMRSEKHLSKEESVQATVQADADCDSLYSSIC